MYMYAFYRVIRRLISMLSNQATLEASNEALLRQAAANAANVDLVEKVKQEKVML